MAFRQQADKGQADLVALAQHGGIDLLDGKVERRACGCHRRMVRLLLPECVVIDHGLTQLNDVASVARSAGDALADRRARVKFLWLWVLMLLARVVLSGRPEEHTSELKLLMRI